MPVLNLQTLLCTPISKAQISGVTLRKEIPLFLHCKVIANGCQVPWVRVTQKKASQGDWSAYSQRTETSPTGKSFLVPLTLQWWCPQGWVGSQTFCRHHSPAMLKSCVHRTCGSCMWGTYVSLNIASNTQPWTMPCEELLCSTVQGLVTRTACVFSV